jgi:hypothetical protein
MWNKVNPGAAILARAIDAGAAARSPGEPFRRGGTATTTRSRVGVFSALVFLYTEPR